MTQTSITSICILSLSVPAGLIIRANYKKIRLWFRRTWTSERIIDFFCNWFELAADDYEKY